MRENLDVFDFRAQRAGGCCHRCARARATGSGVTSRSWPACSAPFEGGVLTIPGRMATVGDRRAQGPGLLGDDHAGRPRPCVALLPLARRQVELRGAGPRAARELRRCAVDFVVLDHPVSLGPDWRDNNFDHAARLREAWTVLAGAGRGLAPPAPWASPTPGRRSSRPSARNRVGRLPAEPDRAPPLPERADALVEPVPRTGGAVQVSTR